MQNVILVIHILACIALIGLVLVQKSEGGGLGIGGGGTNSLMSGRGAAGAIVRTTIIVGGIFFVTSLALTSIANRSSGNQSGIEKALEEQSPALIPQDPVDLFDPSVPLLGNETFPQTVPGTSTVTDPPVKMDDLPANVSVPPAGPESTPADTNPQ